jgi:di/tricarboxylate transporter
MIHHIKENIVLADSRCLATLLLSVSKWPSDKSCTPEFLLEPKASSYKEEEDEEEEEERDRGGVVVVVLLVLLLFLLRYSTQTQTICNTHCKAYPKSQTLSGIIGCSFLLITKIAVATETKARFQTISSTTTGFE